MTVFETVNYYLNNKTTLSDSVKNQYIWLVTGSTGKQGRAKKKVGYAACIANRYVDTLTKADLDLVRGNARAGGAANVSINIWIDKLKATFNFAASEDRLVANPWSKYRPLPAEHRRRPGTLNDFYKIYAVLPEWFQWACRTGMALCLRPGLVELFSLRWSVFDFRHGSVTVFMGKVRRAKTVYPTEEYMSEAKTRFEAAGSDPQGLVCPNSVGRLATGYTATLQAARRKAGVKAFSLYALRHIVASEQLAAGADIAAVSANLGHASPQITLKAYAHPLPGAQRSATASIGAIWRK